MRPRNKAVAAVLLAGALVLNGGTAQAWNPFTESPRTFWCSVWPSFCR